MKRLFCHFAMLLPLLIMPAAMGWSARAPEERKRPPNIVFILVDDLGWADVGRFGSDLHRTPHIDRLAARGVTFTNSYAAAPICSPARASLMTGKYPARLHLTDFIPDGANNRPQLVAWRPFLPLAEVTIPEALKPAGYTSGHFGKWHLNRDREYRPGRPGDPGSQGFDVVLTNQKPNRSDDAAADPHHVRQITDAAIAFIEANRQRPFYCYVTHHTVHRPEHARAELVKQYEERLAPGLRQRNPKYAAMVHELDESVGRIIARLEELRLDGNTIVVFTSDNGGFLGDESDRGTTNYPLRSGKGHLYEGGIRVPTIIAWPEQIKPGGVSAEPIITNDFLPTFVEIASRGRAGKTTPAGVDGLSFLPLLLDPSRNLNRQALYWHYPHYSPQGGSPSGAIRMGSHKLIEFYDDWHVELYDLAKDVGEEHDLAASLPGRAEELRRDLARWRKAIGAQMPVVKTAR